MNSNSQHYVTHAKADIGACAMTTDCIIERSIVFLSSKSRSVRYRRKAMRGIIFFDAKCA